MGRTELTPGATEATRRRSRAREFGPGSSVTTARSCRIDEVGTDAVDFVEVPMPGQ